jgi:hypothetical protein
LVTGTHPADLPHKDGRIQFEQAANLDPALSSWLKWMTQPSLERRFTSAKEALQALEHPPKRNTAPLVITQPFGSKILLTKDGNSLEILMPAKGFSADIVALILFAIAWNSFSVVWTGITVFATPFGINLFFALFSLPFWGVGIRTIWQILSTLFGRVRLRLDQQQISQTYEIFGFKYKRQRSAPRKYISKLELECISNYKHKIIIWAGTQKYEIGGYGHITEPELQWLDYELSDWLQIPIQVKRLSYEQ